MPHATAPEHVYHIASREEWERQSPSGSYRHPSLDAEGFIHCSRREQVPRTLARHFSGRSGLVLLTIDARRVSAPLRYEPAKDGPREKTFPHLYGPLETSAVVAIAQVVSRER